MKVYVLHENPDWYAPLAAALDAAGVPHEQWLLGDGRSTWPTSPPAGVFWSRMSASSHTRGHPLRQGPDPRRAVLAGGARPPGGQRPAGARPGDEQGRSSCRAARGRVRRARARSPWPGPASCAAAARKLPVPFISKHNQGGKGLGRRACSAATTSSTRTWPRRTTSRRSTGSPCCRSTCGRREPSITRAEIVGGEFMYAITADTARGGFELCPADACAVDQPPGRVTSPSLFALREDFDHPVIGRYLEFARRHGHRDRRVRVHRDRGRPPGDLRHQHHDQLQRAASRPRPRGPRCRGGRLPRAAAGRGNRELDARSPWRRDDGRETIRRCGSGTGCRSSAAGCAMSGTRACRVAWPYVRDLAVESEQHGFDLSLIAELNLNDIKGPPRAVAGLLDAGPGRRRGDRAARADARGPAQLPLAVADRQGAVHAGHDRARPGRRSTSCRPGGRTRPPSTVRRSTCTTPGTRGPQEWLDGRQPAAARGHRDPLTGRCTSSTARSSSPSPAGLPPVYMGGESPKAKEVIVGAGRRVRHARRRARGHRGQGRRPERARGARPGRPPLAVRRVRAT